MTAPPTQSVPLVIVSYNNLRYLENTIDHIATHHPRLLADVIVFDSCSNDPETLRGLDRLAGRVSVFRSSWNSGPWVWLHKDFYATLPDTFVLTDADLQWNERLPANFIDVLGDIARRNDAWAVGFALDISQEKDLWQYQYVNDAAGHPCSILEWEQRFWSTRVDDDSGLVIYEASIDTTFALFRKERFQGRCLRVAGDFTAKHLPWYTRDLVLTELGRASNAPTSRSS